jgi:hypothetical protein
MMTIFDDQDPGEPSNTPEQVLESFRVDVDVVAGGASRLTRIMAKLGDQRKPDVVSRGIQRMLTGEVRVAGEMLVILNLLRREKLRAARLIGEVSWTEQSDGIVTAEIADFSISIRPATRGRWRSDLHHKGGYSPTWPKWQQNIEDAKKAALSRLLEAQVELDEVWADNNLSEA